MSDSSPASSGRMLGILRTSSMVASVARRAFLLGGSGQTGRVLIPRLQERGWDVVVGSRGERDIPPGVEHARVDRADTAALKQVLGDEVSLVPTTGHTPGHVSVHIRSQGETALITGDFMHHPCQIARPHWSSTADSDPDEARATRERMLAELAGRPVLVIGTHFAGATAGHIVRDGDAYRLAV